MSTTLDFQTMVRLGANAGLPRDAAILLSQLIAAHAKRIDELETQTATQRQRIDALESALLCCSSAPPHMADIEKRA
jgi:uncharacterized protein involved in exopolysaccharide biosynthesis